MEEPADGAQRARAALGTFVDALHARFGDAVVDVRLFGSFARREANEDSDVDIAVVLERVDWRTKR
jgi:predicted nucleotidyltransferase